ncbi:MAG: bleomycin resistance protein [Pseudooceanicola sp.]|nr:bleomycin resistance protein [Pseudooceanicola sp.]
MRITANLPSRDFGKTEVFYARLGFERQFRNDGWMILRRGEAVVEFFPHARLVPGDSWFSACIRAGDIDALHDAFSEAGLPTDNLSIPRLTGFFQPTGAPRMFALVDEDGSLWRVFEDA